MKNKLEEYLKKYGFMYSKGALEYITKYFEEGLKTNTGADVLRQIYSALSLLPKELDAYNGFLENIKKYFSLEQSILEIGSGYYPSLAKLIDLEQQKLGKGSITIYDEKIVTSNLGNIIINKRLYEPGQEKDKHSLIIGIAPCEATELIIKEANKYHTNLYLALCGCIHDFRFLTTDLYHEYLYYMLKNSLEEEAEIIIEELNDKYNYPNPILIKKKK